MYDPTFSIYSVYSRLRLSLPLHYYDWIVWNEMKCNEWMGRIMKRNILNWTAAAAFRSLSNTNSNRFAECVWHHAQQSIASFCIQSEWKCISNNSLVGEWWTLYVARPIDIEKCIVVSRSHSKHFSFSSAKSNSCSHSITPNSLNHTRSRWQFTLHETIYEPKPKRRRSNAFVSKHVRIRWANDNKRIRILVSIQNSLLPAPLPTKSRSNAFVWRGIMTKQWKTDKRESPITVKRKCKQNVGSATPRTHCTLKLPKNTKSNEKF